LALSSVRHSALLNAKETLRSRRIGPYCADIFNPRAWSEDEVGTNVIVLEFTRVVLAIGVFAIGVELPKAYMARHWKSLFYLLVPVMTWVRFPP
jgi:sodium/hydrogen antiporter